MATDDVSIVVGGVSEDVICTVANEAANTSDEISPLAVTPRGILNRTPLSQRPFHPEVPARNALSGADVIDASQTNNGIIVVDTPNDIGPSDDTDFRTNIDPDPNLPVPESLKDRLFSEGYDSDGLRIEYEDVSK